MQSADLIRHTLQLSSEWSLGVARDMADAPLTQPTPRGGNHPMWVMGHVTYSEADIATFITGEPNPLAAWKPMFDQGTEPSTNAADYPAFDEVLAAFEKTRAATLALLDRFNDASLSAQPSHVPESAKDFPPMQTIGSLLHFIAIHQLCHFGQLTDARRSAGRKWVN